MSALSEVHISPRIWPGKELPVQPGDLSQFAPQGMGLGGPLPMFPWDSLEDVARRPAFYEFQPQSLHPLRGAPATEPCGGAVYFDSFPEKEDFQALSRLLKLATEMREYAVFQAESAEPVEERFVVQLRIVGHGALGYMYGARNEQGSASFEPQKLTLGETLWAFIEDQQERFGSGYSAGLQGCLGGDGDWAKEKLCFGLFVENPYHQIYRIWSRAWLVTK